MDNMISMEQFEQLSDIKRKAQTDDTPYIGIIDDTVNVNGNPNRTEIKPADYEVLFAFPDNPMFRARIEATGDEVIKKDSGYIIVSRKYKSVYITPRMMSDAITAGAVVESFLNKIVVNEDDGTTEVRQLGYDELKDVVVDNFQELKESAYELVASVLRISPEEMDWMLPMNTAENAMRIAWNNPALVNESNLFFG